MKILRLTADDSFGNSVHLTESYWWSGCSATFARPDTRWPSSNGRYWLICGSRMGRHSSSCQKRRERIKATSPVWSGALKKEVSWYEFPIPPMAAASWFIWLRRGRLTRMRSSQLPKRPSTRPRRIFQTVTSTCATQFYKKWLATCRINTGQFGC